MIATLIEKARGLLRFAPEDFEARQRYMPHDWAEWGGNHATCRWCGVRRNERPAGERCKVLL